MNENTFAIAASVLVSFISYCFGVVTPQLELLLWCITIDIFTGCLASFVNPKLMFNSCKMFRGIAKKVILLSMVCFSHHLDIVMNTDTIGLTTCYFFIVNESMSILENCGKAGVKLPRILANSLEQLEKNERKW